jgi:hypothetical protein
MSEQELLEAAVEDLRRRLPSTWALEIQPSADDPVAADLVFRSSTTGAQTLVLVEVKANVSPRDVEGLIGGPWRRWRRQLGNQPILLVAPYIGPRVRELLTEENVSYVDLTGNTRISLDYPGLFIETEGARQDPRSAKPRSAVRGAKAGVAIRVLVDVVPPYTGADIARASKVNEGYLSRILDTLVDEGLIDRERAGVTRVDWPAMLHRRAKTLDLFRPVGTYRYVARQGTSALVDRLRNRRRCLPCTRRIPAHWQTSWSCCPPMPVPTRCSSVPTTTSHLPAPERDGGMAWAAPSQVAVDCLAGSGRMPSEGEALIGWMRANEREWRYPSIQALFDDSLNQGG